MQRGWSARGAEGRPGDHVGGCEPCGLRFQHVSEEPQSETLIQLAIHVLRLVRTRFEDHALNLERQTMISMAPAKSEAKVSHKTVQTRTRSDRHQKGKHLTQAGFARTLPNCCPTGQIQRNAKRQNVAESRSHAPNCSPKGP